MTMSAPEQLDASRARLLPWPRPDGGPCYLRTDGHGYVSRVADQMEAVQLGMGAEVLGCARPIIAAPGASATELRFAAARLAECLADALRIAESRGGRPPYGSGDGGRTEPGDVRGT
ncbi:hypothetical protein EES39_08160 [Streptomyces sp. ADI92-24]|nr:hypothetical protein EDD95_0347 [Streptomyces sp. CEV 2-1]RPK49211.1 hypothetical protein EES39_08160 [Streptomyces sp. ADI92-24]